jgi:hypothetical protein
METLTKPKQVGFLEDYKTQFNNLAINVLGLPEYLTNDFFFLGGLKDEIRSPVRMFSPKSSIDDYSLARIQEECVWNTRRIIKPIWNSTQFLLNMKYSAALFFLLVIFLVLSFGIVSSPSYNFFLLHALISFNFFTFQFQISSIYLYYHFLVHKSLDVIYIQQRTKS